MHLKKNILQIAKHFIFILLFFVAFTISIDIAQAHYFTFTSPQESNHFKAGDTLIISGKSSSNTPLTSTNLYFGLYNIENQSVPFISYPAFGISTHNESGGIKTISQISKSFPFDMPTGTYFIGARYHYSGSALSQNFFKSPNFTVVNCDTHPKDDLCLSTSTSPTISNGWTIYSPFKNEKLFAGSKVNLKAKVTFEQIVNRNSKIELVITYLSNDGDIIIFQEDITNNFLNRNLNYDLLYTWTIPRYIVAPSSSIPALSFGIYELAPNTQYGGIYLRQYREGYININFVNCEYQGYLNPQICELVNNCKHPKFFDTETQICASPLEFYCAEDVAGRQEESRCAGIYVPALVVETCPIVPRTGTGVNTAVSSSSLDGTNDAIMQCKDKQPIVKDTEATIYGVGGPDLKLVTKLDTTGYFRYSTITNRTPLFCNDIYGTHMRSTADVRLGKDGGPRLFSATLRNLSPDTTYYYCAIVSNRQNIGYGGEKLVRSFRTLPCQNCDNTAVNTGGAMVLGNTAYLDGSFNSTKTVKTYFEYREFSSILEAMRAVFLDPLGGVTGPQIPVLAEWRKAGEKTHTISGQTPYFHGSLYQRIQNLKPNTLYQYRATAESSLGKFHGEIKTFTTDNTQPLSCEQLGNCPPDPDFCSENPTHISCQYGGTQGPDLVAGHITPYVTQIDEPTNFKAIITNIGRGFAGGDAVNLATGSTLTHIFQINDSNGLTVNSETEIIQVGGNGIPGGSSEEISFNKVFSSAGMKKIRACASGIDGLDINLNNNCGQWTSIMVACEVGQYYSYSSNSCETPVVCTPGQIYNWSTNTCIPQVTCETDTIYNDWSNTCLPTGINCTLTPKDPFCQPGPGWDWPTWGGPGGGWNGVGWNGVGWNGGGWNGGSWTGGGWFGGSWHGGTWTNGGTGLNSCWEGGVWQNGIWSGGNWCGDLQVGDTATPPWDAIVRSMEGVEHVFARQILRNPALQAKYGFRSGMNLETFSWDTAHLLAQIFGYVGPDGREIRVSYPDIAAYELRLSGNQLTIYEYYDYKIVRVQSTSTNIKTKADYEYYFRK